MISNFRGFNEDGHSRFVGNYVLQLINIVHVSATHLGNYKYAKFVLDNKENSRIIGTLNLNFEDDQKDPELETCTIEAGLEHFTDLVDDTKPALHKWSGVVKLKYHPISTKSTTQIILKRTTASTEWRVRNWLCLIKGFNFKFIILDVPGKPVRAAYFHKETGDV